MKIMVARAIVTTIGIPNIMMIQFGSKGTSESKRPACLEPESEEQDGRGGDDNDTVKDPNSTGLIESVFPLYSVNRRDIQPAGAPMIQPRKQLPAETLITSCMG